MRPRERKLFGERADQFRRRRLRISAVCQFRRRCLHNLPPREEHRTHLLEVAVPKAAAEASREVQGKTLDEPLAVSGSPTPLLLTLDDAPPNQPVGRSHQAVDRTRRGCSRRDEQRGNVVENRHVLAVVHVSLLRRHALSPPLAGTRHRDRHFYRDCWRRGRAQLAQNRRRWPQRLVGVGLKVPAAVGTTAPRAPWSGFDSTSTALTLATLLARVEGIALSASTVRSILQRRRHDVTELESVRRHPPRTAVCGGHGRDSAAVDLRHRARRVVERPRLRVRRRRALRASSCCRLSLSRALGYFTGSFGVPPRLMCHTRSTRTSATASSTS